MSNYLAIATVTAALRQVILQALQAVPKVSGDVQVRTGRPENPRPGFIGASLYLYRVTPNDTLRHKDLPPNLASDAVIKRPCPLDLYYLMSFYGDDKQQEPERFLGSAVTALHQQPALTAELVRQAIANAGPQSYLVESDFDRQTELLQFAPLSLTHDELSRIWGMFSPAAHALSVAYRGSAVLLAS
jgi:hypothetical protein